MIVRLGLTPANFDPTQCDDFFATHDRVLDLWQERGEMATPRPAEVELLPGALRKRWKKSLEKFGSFSCQTPLELAGARSRRDLEEVLSSDAIDVGCLSDNEWKSLGLAGGDRMFEPNGNGNRVGSMVVCRTANCDRVPSVKTAKRMAIVSISVETTPAQLWDQRFERLCKSCKTTVVIIDRYSLDSSTKGLDYRRAASTFLIQRLLDKLGDSCSVQWFARREDRPGSECERLDTLWRQARRGGTLEFFLVPESVFQTHFHHRYIRFDKWCCVLDVGIAVFSGTATKQTEFKFRRLEESDRDTERTLRENGRRWLGHFL